MTIEEARANEGRMVMSRDAGHKMMRCVGDPHGPYLLRKVTKGGMAIIARWEEQDMSVPPSILSLPNVEGQPALPGAAESNRVKP